MEKVVMVTLMLTRNDYVPNPSPLINTKSMLALMMMITMMMMTMTKLQLLPRQLRSQDERK